MSVAALPEGDPIPGALDALDAALDALDSSSLDTLSHGQLLTVLDRLERVNRRFPVTGQRIINRLKAEANPIALGATSLRKLLGYQLRIGQREAGRRIDLATDLGPRQALSGEPLQPTLSATAAAQRQGLVGRTACEGHPRFLRPPARGHRRRDP